MNTTNLFLKKRLLTLCAAVTFATTVCVGLADNYTKVDAKNRFWTITAAYLF